MQHNPAKIALSKDELELATNAQILLTKNRIIQKVYDLFGLLAEAYVIEASNTLPDVVKAVPPKISRGENYLGLPYVMLDYPRYFKKDETLAIRTFFWWGHFFSMTLQLSGPFLDGYAAKLIKALDNGLFQGWYINNNSEMWDHHFEATNYTLITSATDLSERSFIKLATKIPLNEWDGALLFLDQNFAKLLKLLH